MAVNSKSKSTENKCRSRALTNVSNKTEVEVNSTIQKPHKLAALKVQQKHQQQKSLQNKLNENSPTITEAFQCEPLEYGTITTTLKDITETLAERKAKLKSEFFKDNLNVSETKLKRKNNCKLKLKIIRDDHCDAYNNNNNNNNNNNLLGTRTVLPNIFTQKSDCETTIASTTTKTTTTTHTLIEQRKNDLKQKFEAQNCEKKVTDLATFNETVGRFSRVEHLVQKFDTINNNQSNNNNKTNESVKCNKMIVNPNLNDNSALSLKPDTLLEQRNSPLSDEGCNLALSPYSSDNEDNDSIRTTKTTIERSSKRKDKVARSASSDSALGLDVDETIIDQNSATPPTSQQQQQRRMTLTVTDLPLRAALLPLAEPTTLPDSPTTDLQQSLQNLLNQSAVPSKILLEERVIEIPEDPRSVGCSLSNSRRESAQSCISDYPNSECSGVRYVRTPSVVVSDYSDDVMCGITLEEIEYFRAHRLHRRRSSLDTAGTEKDNDGVSDVSAASSCSNLYYCGSTISALDGAECYVNGNRTTLERKTSDCSTCSVSGDEDAFTIPEQPEDAGNELGKELSKELSDLLAAQHLNSKRPKKVGAGDLLTDTNGLNDEMLDL